MNKEYEELVRDLRYCAMTDISDAPYPCDGCSYNAPEKYHTKAESGYPMGCSSMMMLHAADAIERLDNTITIPDENAMVCGFPLKELIAFAGLARREGITEADLHDFCTNAVRGFEAGQRDLQIAYEKSLQRFKDNLSQRAKVFRIPEIKTEDGDNA